MRKNKGCLNKILKGHLLIVAFLLGLFLQSEARAFVINSGTSFSSPHVAGTMALLLSAFPALTVSDSESILEDAPNPLVGVPLPNNNYGYGLIDGVNAYKAAFTAIHANIPEIAAFPSSYNFGQCRDKENLPPPGLYCNQQRGCRPCDWHRFCFGRRLPSIYHRE
jgi:hypothetical protein